MSNEITESTRKTWTKKEENYIRKHIHLTNAELALKLDRTENSVADKVRKLGLARTWRKEEVEILKNHWGEKKKELEKLLRRFTWRQISRKANRIGLPPLHEARESVHLYSIIKGIGGSDSTAKKWLDAGLPVTRDKGKKFKNSVVYVDIDEFWDFALAHPDIVDVCRIPEDIVGHPPPEIIELRRTLKPHPKRRKRLSESDRKAMAALFYQTNTSMEKCSEMFGVSVDTARHIVCKLKEEGQYRDRSTVVTKSFLRRLDTLLYVEHKTNKECAELLGCSQSSIQRGINKLYELKIEEAKKNTK